MLARAGLDAVIFDVGGVLYHWHPRHLYAKLIDEPAELDRFLAEVVTLDWHFQHDAGRPFAETSAELIARFPQHRALIEAYGPRWLETVPGPVEGMLDLVHALADAGVPLFGITNFSAEFWPRFTAVESVFARFADVIVSGEHGMVKPDPAIFELARRRFPAAPERTLFVDDRLENVQAAEAAGYLGHHFTNAATLRARLGL
jgi:2-haloacid dehalogenase